MLIAAKYFGSVGIGVTSPQLFQADDGNAYVVKLQNNRLGPKVLVNEFLAARLGEMLGLCLPPGDIIRIDEEILRRSRRLRNWNISAGLHFACRYLSGAQYVGRHNLGKARNKAEMAGVMLFDHIMHNVDRTWHRKNLLMCREDNGYKIYAIDHSHLFRRGKWTVSLLKELVQEVKVNHRRVYGLLLKYFLMPEDFMPYVQKIEQIPDTQFVELIEAIPREWLPQDDERQALLDYLVVRRDLAGAISTKLCELIPDNNRRSDTNKLK